MAPQPPPPRAAVGPRIPLDLADAPTQRLYLVAAFLLLQAFKLPNLIVPSSQVPLPDELFNWRLLQWLAMDTAAVVVIRWLRVPRFAWGWRGTTLLVATLVLLDWLLFGRWKLSAAIFLPGFVKGLLATYLSTTERPVRLASVLGADGTHLGGHYTVHILAVSTAQLNPTSSCYCIPSTSSPGPILVPLILNNTIPSRLTYSIASLSDPTSVRSVTISSSSLIRPASEIVLSPTDPDFDEVNEWALGPVKASSSPSVRHRLPASRDPADPFDLSPSESLYYLPIKTTGVIRLESLLDHDGVQVRIRRKREPGSKPGESEGVKILPCPRAGFATRQAQVHSCLNPTLPQSLSLNLAVSGYEPLTVTWHSTTERGTKVQRGRPESIEGIKDDQTSTVTTGVLPVPMNVSIADVGRQTFFLDRVQDGCGNVVSYENPLGDPEPGSIEGADGDRSAKVLPGMLDVREFVVHAIPEVTFGGQCGKGEDVKLLKGAKKTLEIKLSALERAKNRAENRWTIGIRFTGENGKKWEREVVSTTANTGYDVSEPGVYEIISVRGHWCEGIVLVPSVCTVVAQPLPSLATTFAPLLDVCSSEIGVVSTLHLTGAPPFTVTYALSQLSPVARTTYHKKTVSHSRAEIRIEPGPGEWSYRFVKLQDAFYNEFPLAEEAQYARKQTVQLVGGAQWSDAAQGKTVHSCDGETVTVEVDLKAGSPLGASPWELEYSVVGEKTQIIKDIKQPRHSFDITIPPLIAKRGGKFSLSLESVRDGNGCRRPITAQDLAIDVRRTKPTARFPGAKGARSVVIRDQDEAKIPLRLTGEGPWTIAYLPPSSGSKARPEPVVVKAPQPNIEISLPFAEPGTYTLLTVRDKYCPGDVADVDWTVSTLPRPTLRLAESAGRLVKNGSIIRKAVCENTPDSVTVLFDGKPPFNAPYTLTKGSWTGEALPRSLPAIQPRADLTLFTASGGHHTYLFSGVGDSLYTTPDRVGLVAPTGGRDGLVRLEQDVFPLPDAKFKQGAKHGFCINDRLASRSPEDLVLQLQGQPPFEVELEVREEGHRATERFSIPGIMTQIWPVELPISLKTATSHVVSLRRISDANGCARIFERTAPGASTTVSVAEIASISPVLPQATHCVGDFLEFVLQGSPPFTVEYEFNSKRHSVPLSSSRFSRVAAAPGTFKILSVGHGSDECKSNAVDLVKTVYAIPTARVSEGKDVFVDIREGDQTEIVFSFVGEPPFTFTYSRRQPQDRVKDRTVLETHTVTGIMEHSYSIFTSQEGTWSVSYIADAHCSFPATTMTRSEE